MYFVLIYHLHAGLTSCLQFRMNDRKVKKYFEAKNADLKIDYLRNDEQTLRYLQSGTAGAPLFVFIHGAPGAADNFKELMSDPELTAKAEMIAFDRPGYGYSGLGKSVPGIQDQVRLLKPFFDRLDRPAVFVGHSYGGPIAVRAAADFPEKCRGLVLLAGAFDPDNELSFWVNKPADWFFIRPFIPASLRSANDEKLAHPAELRKMLPLWEKITVPTVILQGDSDRLVPEINGHFAKKMLKNAPAELEIMPGQNHFLPWNNTEAVKKAIFRFL